MRHSKRDVTRLAKLLCKVQVDWSDRQASPDAIWRQMRPITRDVYRRQAQYVLDNFTIEQSGQTGSEELS